MKVCLFVHARMFTLRVGCGIAWIVSAAERCTADVSAVRAAEIHARNNDFMCKIYGFRDLTGVFFPKKS